MRTYRIGICSTDPEYAAGLMMALNQISRGEIEAVVFSRPEVVMTCVPFREPDLLIMDDWRAEGEETAEKMQELEKAYGIPVCRLTEQPSEEGIFKYQSVREICKALLTRLRDARGVVPRYSGSIAVYSPLGRCGKTALARALACTGGGRGMLYIDMEEFTEADVHSEVLYQIKQRIPDIYEAVVREQTMEEGMMILRVSGMYSELKDVQPEDLKWLHEQLLQPGRYQSLIYDVGSAVLSDISCLQVFDRIYMPVLPDDVSRRKVDHFREILRKRKLGELLLRICPVELSEDAIRTGDPQRILQCLEECA